jgi:hypothetical protein
MAGKSDPRKPRKPSEVELEPDAWPRFERFIREIASAGLASCGWI